MSEDESNLTESVDIESILSSVYEQPKPKKSKLSFFFWRRSSRQNIDYSWESVKDTKKASDYWLTDVVEMPTEKNFHYVGEPGSEGKRFDHTLLSPAQTLTDEQSAEIDAVKAPNPLDTGTGNRKLFNKFITAIRNKLS